MVERATRNGEVGCSIQPGGIGVIPFLPHMTSQSTLRRCNLGSYRLDVIPVACDGRCASCITVVAVEVLEVSLQLVTTVDPIA